MHVKALDTICVSSAGGRKEAGAVFEVSDHEAGQLIARGLVEQVAGAAPEKGMAPPENKAARKPRNKAK